MPRIIKPYRVLCVTDPFGTLAAQPLLLPPEAETSRRAGDRLQWPFPALPGTAPDATCATPHASGAAFLNQRRNRLH